jgi:uncharacterized protein YciI
MALFVVVNEQGPHWQPSRPMREQDLWKEHAAFINEAMHRGSVLLGGPIGNGAPHRALLVVSAENEATVRAWLASDPWMTSGTLRVASVETWNILVSNDRLDPVLAELSKSAASP